MRLTTEELTLLIKTSTQEHSIAVNFGPGWAALKDEAGNDWARELIQATRESMENKCMWHELSHDGWYRRWYTLCGRTVGLAVDERGGGGYPSDSGRKYCSGCGKEIRVRE